tara:strand:+ start:409 stop:555 length:147 start_codon:yes stop_codon:yes gene_type:complete
LGKLRKYRRNFHRDAEQDQVTFEILIDGRKEGQWFVSNMQKKTYGAIA